MIVGVAHLTMESGLPDDLDRWRRLGFTLEFFDDVALPPEFEGVADAGPSLPLALLRAGNGLDLEIVQHRRHSGQAGAYSGIFTGPPPAGSPRLDRPDVAALLEKAETLRSPVCTRATPAGGEAWFDSAAGGGPTALGGFLCRVSDVGEEAEFWTRLARFRWTECAPDARRTAVRSPVLGRQYVLVLTAGQELPRRSMNDVGFPSIGVYTTAVDRDFDKALSAGATPRAAPITTRVGGREVQMALVETPGGALVELLSVRPPAAGR